MKHRILHIVASLARSGTNKQLALLAEGLDRGEFEMHVAALDLGGPAQEDFERLGIKPVVVGRRWRYDPFAFWRLRKLIRRLRPQIVHTWLYDANRYGRKAAWSAGVRKLVASERAIDRWKIDHELAVDRRLAKYTSRVIVNSLAVRDFYIACGIPAAKIVHIPSGIGPAQASTLSRGELLAQLNLPPAAELIAYVGTLTIEKRLKELIWGVDQLRAVATEAHLVVIGEGLLRQPLERYARLNHVQDRVHFLGERGDVGQILPHVDVLWQAGDCEGQSCAVLEAMAAGVPVVAADSAGNRELVVHGETGYLAPVNSRAALARLSLPVLEDIQLAKRLGAAARRRAVEKFSASSMVSCHADVYHEILNG